MYIHIHVLIFAYIEERKRDPERKYTLLAVWAGPIGARAGVGRATEFDGFGMACIVLDNLDASFASSNKIQQRCRRLLSNRHNLSPCVSKVTFF